MAISDDDVLRSRLYTPPFFYVYSLITSERSGPWRWKKESRAEACVGPFLEVDEHAAFATLVEKRKHGYGFERGCCCRNRMR